MRHGSPGDPKTPHGRSRVLWLILGAIALAGCAGLSDAPRFDRNYGAAAPDAAACIAGYELIDRAVARAGTGDAEARRIDGFPYLRVNRFLASFADDEHVSDAARVADAEPFDAWVERLITLDQQGRAIEIGNLPAPERADLETEVRPVTARSIDALVADCPAILEAQDFIWPDARAALRVGARVPDDYSTFARTLGVYPLSAIPIAFGYDRWKEEHLVGFDQPLDAREWIGAPTLHTPADADAPPASAEIAAVLARVPRDALGIPVIAPDDLAWLAGALAPTFLVDVASDADRIGRPAWGQGDLPIVDVGDPVAFVRLAYARFDGEILPQLIYLVWFPERPEVGPFDILSGHLDGLAWRVTLGKDGQPLIHDTIHPCGCYHLFFPTAAVSRRPLPEDRAGDLRETIDVPQIAPTLAAGERLAIGVAANSHYVGGLAGLDALPADWERVSYRLVIGAPIPDAELRSMPQPDGGRKSLYGADGLVAGTERRERVFLWPSGVVEPGAMRQWGRHATAFVGRRHFDDSDLLDRGFRR